MTTIVDKDDGRSVALLVPGSGKVAGRQERKRLSWDLRHPPLAQWGMRASLLLRKLNQGLTPKTGESDDAEALQQRGGGVHPGTRQ